ncbi:MAG: methyltransferase domain-containing protein [Thermaerobacter sp.]|nr:methyltransferase domain-containing protein [Thermaerobacter sp.]
MGRARFRMWNGTVRGLLCRRDAHRIVGVDLSENMIAYARTHHAADNIVYQRVAVEDVDFTDGLFDLVVSSFVMHHVADYGAVVQKVYQWLRPGGRFVYSCEHPIVTAQQPGGGHWLSDDRGQHRAWCVDNYGDAGRREQTWFIEGVIKYHRALATLLNGLMDHGFAIDRVLEPQATREAIQQRPALVAEGRRPPVLVVATHKLP